METENLFPRPVRLRSIYTAFERELKPDYIFRGESHDFYELVMILSGTVGITAGSDSFLLKEGTAILHTPMEFHSLRAANGTSPTVLIITFFADALPDYQKRIFLFSEEERARASRALSLLRNACRCNGIRTVEVEKGRERRAQEGMNELEILLLRADEVSEPERLLDETTGSSHYKRALRVLEENLTLPLSTNELAALCHMSPSLLKKTFSRYAGVGVIEYFRARKIEAAIPFLRNGQSVSDTALRFGFSDSSYFSTVFHKITGHTPGYYRNH